MRARLGSHYVYLIKFELQILDHTWDTALATLMKCVSGVVVDL